MTQGWTCPRCQRIYGPAAEACEPCNAEMMLSGATAKAKEAHDAYRTRPILGGIPTWTGGALGGGMTPQAGQAGQLAGQAKDWWTS